MKWHELYDHDHEPTEAQICDFVATPLYEALDGYLRQAYNVKPKLAYSGCKMGGDDWMGWNIKYKKSGKSLTTIYPKQGYLLLLLAIGAREMNEAELLMPSCTAYIQELFAVEPVAGAKYLAIELRDEQVLRDVKNLINIRVKPKQK